MRFSAFIILFLASGILNAQEIIYKPFSNSVIKIHINEPISDTIYVEAYVINITPRGGNGTDIKALTKAGSYYLNLQVDRPAKAQLNIIDNVYNIILLPDDTTNVELYSKSEFTISFNDDLEPINTYYLRKNKFLKYSDRRIPFNKILSSKSTYSSIKEQTDFITKQEVIFLEDYILSQDLPGWFINYEKAEIIYSGADFKTHIPHYNNIFKVFSDTLSVNYFNFLDDLNITNQNAIASSAYFYFLDNYFLKDLPTDEFHPLSGFERVNTINSHIAKRFKNELSGVVKNIYQQRRFSTMLQYYTDPVEIDSLANVFEINEYEDFLVLSGTRSKVDNNKEWLDLIPGDTIPEFYLVDFKDSIFSIRDFEDQIVYVNFWATWCGPCIKNMPELNKLIALYADDPRISFVNICLDSKKNDWQISVSKYNINGVNLYAAGKWNQKLRSYFNIKGIPHYALIKEDNILFENSTEKAPVAKDKIDELLILNNNK